MKLPKLISPFRLASLLRIQKDPKLALDLFRNPNFDGPSSSASKQFRHSPLCYDLIITKLGAAKMFPELEEILLQLKTQTRFAPKEVIFCNVIQFYARARRLEDATKVFEEIPAFRCQRTVRSFNSLLNAFLMCKEADRMVEFCAGVEQYAGGPDAVTYNILFRWCFSKGMVDAALKLFDEMLSRNIRPTVVTFVTLIKGLCSANMLEEALKLKSDMVNLYRITPNAYIYSSLMKFFCVNGELNSAFKLRDEMIMKGIALDSSIYSTLINALFQGGKKEEALQLWDEMNRSSSECKPDTVTYNVMISGFCRNQDFSAAYQMFDEMSRKGRKPDVVSYNVVLDALCKHGRWQCAYELFESMPGSGCLPDVLSYRIVFRGLCDGMQFEDAAFVLDEMIFKGFAPHPGSVCAFFGKLCEQRNMEMAWSVLDTLAKGNAIDLDTWGMAVAAVGFEEDMLSRIRSHVDSLGRC
ncbi:unnamed protein product [Linum tenue]|uniref:Pentatricopeptide repeat-containing protein n=1 Tax=Linum tenue TaxID=586396 RepID=A0AAV0M5C3_9ROSI|nr:unnamed protein product [Linum tenue]